MSTATITTNPANVKTTAPGAGTTPLRIGPAQTLRHGLALAGRGVIKIRKSPAQLADVILTPIIFLLMFYYLFGGAIGGGHLHTYLQTIVPGIMVMTVYQASIGIGVALSADTSTGVFDRFRSMPIARSAPLIGAVLADIVRYLVALTVLITVAVAMGYRFQTNPITALAGLALLLGFALAFSWMSVWVGMLVKSPGSVQGLMTIIVIPLTFASNVFVPSQTMPGWLRAWSHINPVSLMTATMRGLLNGGPVTTPLLESLTWMTAAVLIFFPLALRAYRKNAA